MGRLRRPPCGVRIRETASSRSGRKGVSWAFAPLSRLASGIPCASVIRCRLVPGLPRSVGLGPTASPPFVSEASRCRDGRVPTRCIQPGRGDRAGSAAIDSRPQTPAACQSRSRRQQVTPDPQPISCGSSSHASPALRTKMIPVKQARSGTRGRPPFGFGGSGGSRGATSAQRSSVTNGLLRRRHLLLPSPHHPCQF